MKKALVIIFCCILGILLLGWGVQLWLNGKIEKAISEQLTQTKNGYTVTTGNVKVRLLDRSLKVTEFNIKRDSAAGAGLSMNLSTGRIKVSGIQIRQLIKTGNISVGTLRLTSPRFLLVDPGGDTGDSEPASIGTVEDVVQAADTTVGAFASIFSGFEINRIIIADGRIEYRVHTTNGPQEYVFESLEIDAEGFSGDTTRTDKTFYCDEIKAFVGQIRYTNEDASVVTTADTLRLDTKSGELTIEKVNITPQFDMWQFAYHNFKHADWTEVSTGRIAVTGVDFSRIIGDRVIRADSVAVESSELASYKNRQIDRVEWVKPLTYQSIQELGYKIDIRKAHVGNTKATYYELPKGEANAGMVFVDDITVDWDGLTNMAETGRLYYPMRSTGKFMGEGEFDVTFMWPVVEFNDHVEVEGTMGPMRMSAANDMVRAQLGAEAASGQITSLWFYLSGDSRNSSVQMKLHYENLSVSLLKEHNGTFEQRKFISWAANTFVVKSSNPDNRGERIGQGTYERDPYRSQFNYLWKSLLPGIKGSVGL